MNTITYIIIGLFSILIYTIGFFAVEAPSSVGLGKFLIWFGSAVWGFCIAKQTKGNGEKK